MFLLMITVFICFDLTRYEILSTKYLALNGLSFSQPIRLIGYSVLHIDLSHLIMNLFSVFVLTPYLFKTYQIKRQVVFFTTSPVLVGALCVLISIPSNPIGAIGYSGAVFAMIGAIWFNHPSVFKKLSLMALASTLFWWATNVPMYHAAHIIGYIVGLGYGYSFYYLNNKKSKS